MTLRPGGFTTLQPHAKCEEKHNANTNPKLTSETIMFKLYVSVHLQQSIIEFFAVSVYRPMGFKEREITSTFHTIIGKII